MEVSQRTLRIAAWGLLLSLGLVSLLGGMWLVALFAELERVAAVLQILTFVTSIPWLYSTFIFAKFLDRNLGWAQGSRQMMLIFWLFIAAAVLAPLTFFEGTPQIIGWILIGLLQIVEGIPILLISMKIYRERIGLLDFGQVFSIFGIITAISLFTVIGFLLVGSATYLGWFVIMALVMLKAAKSGVGAAVPGFSQHAAPNPGN